MKADPRLNDEENSEKSSQDGSPTEEGEKRGGVAGLFGNPFEDAPSLDKPPKNTSNDNNNPFQTSEAMAVLNAAMSEDFSAEEKKKYREQFKENTKYKPPEDGDEFDGERTNRQGSFSEGDIEKSRAKSERKRESEPDDGYDD